jgi:hypothetical protein
LVRAQKSKIEKMDDFRAFKKTQLFYSIFEQNKKFFFLKYFFWNELLEKNKLKF